MDRILVLDGEARSALAAVRSLGRLGLEVAVAAAEPPALAQRSRYASRKLACPSPARAPQDFQDWLRRAVAGYRPHLLLPLTDLSLGLTLELEQELRAQTVLPFVDRATCARVQRKGELMALASELGVRVPRTLALPPAHERGPEHEQALDAFPFPAVLKPEVTQSRIGDGYARLPVAYPASAAAARALLAPGSAYAQVPVLLQQRVEGLGVGVFALCSDGEPAALFAHRRLLEKPPSGGVSVLSESLPLERAPIAEALRLLRALRWQGAAMLEFKLDREGLPHLLEINPRFWGSLQLAIDSGRDFPALLYQLFRSGEPLRGEKLERLRAELPPLRAGQRLRWGFGTLDHALIRLKAAPREALLGMLLRNELRLFERPASTRLEVLRASDPGPCWGELRSWLRALPRRAASA